MTDLARCTLVKMGEFFGMRGSVSLMGLCGDARGFVRKRTDNEGMVLQHGSWQRGSAARMKSPVPRTLTVSATSIGCPFCDAEPGRDCITTLSRFAAVHIERVKEAARINRGKFKK